MPAVQIDQSPVVIDASDEHENTLVFLVFNKLNPIGFLVLARAARRQAVQVLRIIGETIPLPKLEEVSGPTLEGSHFVHICDICQQSILVRPNIRPDSRPGSSSKAWPNIPSFRLWDQDAVFRRASAVPVRPRRATELRPAH